MKKYVITSLVLVALLLSLIGVQTSIIQASDGLVTSDLNTGLTPADLVNTLVGEGVSVSNISFNGANRAAGTFSGGSGIIGFDSGIILSTGNIASVVGPNDPNDPDYDSTTTNNGQPGDADLDSLIPGYQTFDATVLEFDFVSTSPVVSFIYVFGSEEYNEFVNSPYNNVFGFFINGVNQALIPGTTTPVAINNVNGGNPYGQNASNPNYYRNNDLDDSGGLINTELDGLTVVLGIMANVNMGETNHMKLAIADAGDYILDSDVFIKAGSLVAPDLTLTPIADSNITGTSHTVTATAYQNGVIQVGVTVNFQVVSGPNTGKSGIGVTDGNGEATWSYTGNTPGEDVIIATATVGGSSKISNNAYKTWYGEQLEQLVEIDIKPGSYPNSINPNSKGVVPVAILGSADFDVTVVDTSTIVLAGAGVRLKGKSTNAGSYEDVNGNGYVDLVVQISTEDLTLVPGQEMAVLTGLTYDDVPITGIDSVKIVPPK